MRNKGSVARLWSSPSGLGFGLVVTLGAIVAACGDGSFEFAGPSESPGPAASLPALAPASSVAATPGATTVPITPSPVVTEAAAPPVVSPVSPPAATIVPPLPAKKLTLRSDIELPVIHSERPARPIIGGTLLPLDDAQRLVAADPDRDAVYVIDLSMDELVATVQLEPADEPTRLAQGAGNEVYVVLRGSDTLAVVDAVLGTLLERVPVCHEPRGVAFDAERRRIVVVCRGGQVQWLDAETREQVWSTTLPDDLRDVVVSGPGYWISRFKSAQLLFVDSTTGFVGEPRAAATIEPPAGTPTNVDGSYASVPGQFDSRVLSRLVPSTDGNIVLQHHHQNRGQLVSAYYGRTSTSTGGIAHGAVTTFVVETQSFVPLGATPNAQVYDLATSRDGTHLAAIATDLYGSTVYDTETSGRSELGPVEIGTWTETPIAGQASAVAFDAEGRTLVQVREPAALEIVGVTRIALSDDSRYDTGHVLFHASTPTGVACATCHPEGGDDGMTWDFGPFGLRQTAPLNTGIMETFPLHWQGELPTIAEVMAETFVSRMGGPAPSPAQAQALGLWLQDLSLAVAEESSMDDPAKRGRDVFVQLRCDACHSGARLTDNLNHDVGTGAEFQTPPLVGLRYSAPYMRDGCAATLWDRFDPACGGPQHGDTSTLDEQELSDLVRYLEAL